MVEYTLHYSGEAIPIDDVNAVKVENALNAVEKAGKVSVVQLDHPGGSDLVLIGPGIPVRLSAVR